MKKPILVTGAHRSGSTWIGDIISTAPNITNITEPFNIAIKRKSCPLTYWFEHLSMQSPPKQQRVILDYLKSYYSLNKSFLADEFSKVNSLKQIHLLLYKIKVRLTYRPLLKDPIAIMSAEWIHQQLNCDVVVSVRHPAAFIASLKAKSWEFNFANYLHQPSLMNTYLKSYQDTIKAYTEHPPDIIHQGILLWNTIYSTVFSYQQKYPDRWLFIRHEDLSADPLKNFQLIFDYLNIPVTKAVQEKIIKSTTATHETDLHRDSKKNITSWKERLSDEEIKLIKTETHQIAKEYYTEDDW